MALEDSAEMDKTNIRGVFWDEENRLIFSDTKFIKYFRLSKNLMRSLSWLLHSFHLQQGPALIVETKVLVALKFFGIETTKK
ncbi:hypothetical protein HHI36_018408 [Cryptolaemus montrouzieri]|uniref:Uncharacterized protein n=1 Tax=Cryptolaemus montrouzieri TaxID=559131 RepID=A0ABD2NZV9_9CUCU